MKNIQALIDKRGGFQSVYNDYIRLENPPFMPLCVEVLGGDGNGGWHVSVCHYGEQGGDQLRDPDIEFLVRDGKWQPISFRNDYLGAYSEFKPDSAESRDAAEFAAMWDNNLKEQGFFDL